MNGTQENKMLEPAQDVSQYIGIKKRKQLSLKRLNELLYYDKNTGSLVRKIEHYGFKKGTKCGCKTDKGYILISIDGILYKAHRLVWFYVYGYFPENDIDHINKIKSDNRIENLREVSRTCNMRNIGNIASNISGVKGVSYRKGSRKWEAYITINKIHKNLGLYKNFDNAVCARLAGEQCLNWSNCESNSPAYKYVQKNIIRKGE